jgi:hypothetical protein
VAQISEPNPPTSSRLPSEVPGGENGDGQNGQEIPKNGSMLSIEEVDGLVEPVKKKKKAKKAKKVKFDDVSFDLRRIGPS